MPRFLLYSSHSHQSLSSTSGRINNNISFLGELCPRPCLSQRPSSDSTPLNPIASAYGSAQSRTTNLESIFTRPVALSQSLGRSKVKNSSAFLSPLRLFAVHIMTDYERRPGGPRGGYYNNRKRRFRGLSPLDVLSGLSSSHVTKVALQRTMIMTDDSSAEGTRSLCLSGFANSS